MNDKGALSLNAAYLEENYEAWLKDPSSVPADLANFYAGFEFGQSQGGGLARKHLQSAVDSLVFHYRSVGHRSAEINPLNISRPPNPELEFASYGLSEENLQETFGSNHLAGFPAGHAERDHFARKGDVLRPHRRRVHAHPEHGRAPVPAGADGARTATART